MSSRPCPCRFAHAFSPETWKGFGFSPVQSGSDRFRWVQQDSSITTYQKIESKGFGVEFGLRLLRQNCDWKLVILYAIS